MSFITQPSTATRDVNVLLATILEEFVGEQMANDQVSIYRWVQNGTVEEVIMELIFKYE